MKKYYEYNKRWRMANIDKVRKHRKKWKLKNPDKVKEEQKRYRLRHKKHIKKYRLLHPKNRGGSRNWKHYPIEELIKRDGRKCKKCGVTKGLSINHKIPRVVYSDDGKIWDVPLKELEILCSKCNNEHYQRIVKKALRFYFRSKLKNKLT